MGGALYRRRGREGLGNNSPVLIVSGSIGLMPLVQRLGIPDRVNYLDPFRLGPWGREASIECFDRLAKSTSLVVDDGVGGAVYDALGIGIPHHVQSFFARLRDFAAMENRDRVTVADVDKVYRTGLLGPSGQNDLAHYETRLGDALDEKSRSIAMEMLAEAATQGVLTAGARVRLGELYSRVVGDAHARISEILDLLVHDGYLEAAGEDHEFPSRLLKDWWAARFRAHHVPIADRSSDAAEGRTR